VKLLRLKSPTLALLATMIMLATASCGGGGGNSFPSSGGDVSPSTGLPDARAQLTSYLSQQAAQLTPYASSAKGSIKGTLAITGYTILDPRTMLPLPAGTAIAKVPLRLVDPEDDVDSIVYPSLNGTFQFLNLPVLNRATLKVEFFVAEDVNGDHQGKDKVTYSLVVSVAAGKQTYVQITIKPLQQPSPIPGYTGTVPQIKTYYNGPDGTRNRNLAIFGATGQTFMDSNNDGQFTSTDIQFADANGDGQSNQGEAISTGGNSGAGTPLSPDFTTAGIISSISEAELTVTVPGQGDLNFTMTESTTFVDGLGSPIAISDNLIGREVAVYYQPANDDSRLALVIMVFFQQPVGL
jgi:hypothetical protein